MKSGRAEQENSEESGKAGQENSEESGKTEWENSEESRKTERENSMGFRLAEQDDSAETEAEMSGDIVRKKLIFKGEVQFVGFRFQSKYLADTLGLTGYVENLPNGDVLMEVQGRMKTIQDMIVCLHQKRPIRIDSMEEETLPVQKREKGFRYIW